MRTEIELNNGWRFAKIYNLGISENDAVTPEFDDCSWEKVCLPHTFNATDSVDRKSTRLNSSHAR